ncbi:MAG: hypothetical protein NC357_09010 [Bacteroides sp.]|nr:hypothetical protein [Bacteroides sp.]
MKSKKNFKTAWILVAAAMVFSLALTGCGGSGGGGSAKVNGTYTMELSAEQCAGNLYAAGFMDSVQASQTNTLVLENGSYTLTKQLNTPEEITSEAGTFSPNVKVVFTFTGKYTMDDDVVVLDKAAECEFDANYGVFVEMGAGLLNDSGKASSGDMVNCFGSWDDDPLDFFAGEYFNKTFNDEVRVQINAANSSYELVKAASSDDD